MRAFISYPSEALDTAREVYGLLTAIGIDTWFDKERLIAGEDWARAIKIALQASDLVVLVCSAHVVSRAGVIQQEIKDALDLLRHKPLGHIFLVPLRTADIRLPLELAERQYVDHFRHGWQLALARASKLRLEQLGEEMPADLVSYLASCERAGGVEFLTLKKEIPGFIAEADYFVYKTGGEYWDYVTSDIRSDIFGSYYEASAFAAERDYEMKASKFILPMGMSWSRRVQEYFRDGDLISLQVDAWSFFGGAHGTRGIYTKNYGGPEVGALGLRQLFEYEAANKIREHCVEALSREDGDSRRALLHLLDDPVDKWKPFEQWLFNRDGVRFWFSMYSTMPFVAGVFDVSAPWSVLKKYLKDSCRDTPFGKMVLST